MPGVDGQAFATEDYCVRVTVESDNTVNNGMRGGEGGNGHEHDEQGSEGGDEVTHGEYQCRTPRKGPHPRRGMGDRLTNNLSSVAEFKEHAIRLSVIALEPEVMLRVIDFVDFHGAMKM